METGEMFPGTQAFRKLLSFFCSKSSPSYQLCKEYMFATVGPTYQWNDVSYTVFHLSIVNIIYHVMSLSGSIY